ncbi:hypothetical protein ACFL0H_04120 [Thermodesulfobacteriota bacterium]
MDDDHLNGGLLDGGLMDGSLRQKDSVVLRMGTNLLLVASLQLDDPIRHYDYLVVGMPFLGRLVTLPGEDNLNLELVFRSFEHSRDIWRLHG